LSGIVGIPDGISFTALAYASVARLGTSWYIGGGVCSSLVKTVLAVEEN